MISALHGWRSKRAAALVLTNLWLVVALLACGDDDAQISHDKDAASETDAGGHEPPPPSHEKDAGKPPPKPVHDAGPEMDAAAPIADAGSDAGDANVIDEPDAQLETDAAVDASEPEPPLTLGGLTVDTTVDDEEEELDLFGVWGHRFWIDVTDEQLERMNQGQYGGGGYYGDIYSPGGSARSYADHVLVENASTHHVADYGKLEVRLVGQSTYRQWSKTSIPNVRIDADEFNMGNRIGGFEHLRLNNALGLDNGNETGTMFREQIGFRIYRELGYPAPRSGYAFLGSNVWGEDVWVPMILTEVYKRKFCEDNAEALGGTCEYIWEFASDIGPGGYYPGGGGQQVVPPEWCQVRECDNTRLEELMGVLASTPHNAGFRDATEPYIDWQRFQQFQCFSWILQTTDDPIHGGNNTVMVLRDDGRFIWEPYSIDISMGYAGDSALTGYTSVADGCQKDPACWADMINVCEDLVNRFDELDPEKFVDQAVDGMTELGMMRNGDDQRAAHVRDWLVNRQTQLPTQLERYRYLPDGNGNCPDGMQLCGDGGCGTETECYDRQCQSGTWCESRQSCINSDYDQCPTCPEETPYYCDQTAQCTDDLSGCYNGYCNGYPPGYAYCPYYGQCIQIQYCPGRNDDDAGVDGPPVAGMGGPIIIDGEAGGIALPNP